MTHMVTEMYLGDAVYASFDGYHLWLTTSDGITTTNKIALEPGVLNMLDMFRKQLQTPRSLDEAVEFTDALLKKAPAITEPSWLDEEDCGCSDGAELKCISITCPRK